MAFVGQASTQAAQKIHLPKSSNAGPPGGFVIACVGQTSTHTVQLSVHLDASNQWSLVADGQPVVQEISVTETTKQESQPAHGVIE